MTPEKTESIKQRKKKEVTTKSPILLEIVSEDKTAGTMVVRPTPIPPPSKGGGSQSEKIQNDVIEAASQGDATYANKDFMIVYTDVPEGFAVRPETKAVAKKRS